MTRVAKRLMQVVLTVVVIVYAALILLANRSDSLIFQPQPSSYSDRSIPSPFQIVKLKSGSGEKQETITAVYLPNAAARYTLLMSHGNAEDIGQNLDVYEEFARRGFAVFAYDYRGYGTSAGHPSEGGVYQDEAAAWEYVTGKLGVDSRRVIVHGTSVGCGPAVELAWRLSQLDEARRPAALVLVSPFTSAFTVLTRVRLLPWDKFDNERRIAKVNIPVLVVHGTNDEVIPFVHGTRVWRNAQPEGEQDAPLTRDGGKRHFWIKGAGHNNIFMVAAQAYFDAVERFAAELPGGAAKSESEK